MVISRVSEGKGDGMRERSGEGRRTAVRYKERLAVSHRTAGGWGVSQKAGRSRVEAPHMKKWWLFQGEYSLSSFDCDLLHTCIKLSHCPVSPWNYLGQLFGKKALDNMKNCFVLLLLRPCTLINVHHESYRARVVELCTVAPTPRSHLFPLMPSALSSHRNVCRCSH